MKSKNNFDYEMIRVEGGYFAIVNFTDIKVKGASKENSNRHLILDSFSIGKYPVTKDYGLN